MIMHTGNVYSEAEGSHLSLPHAIVDVISGMQLKIA